MTDLAAEARAVAGDVYLYDEADWWDERERIQGLLRALAAEHERLEGVVVNRTLVLQVWNGAVGLGKSRVENNHAGEWLCMDPPVSLGDLYESMKAALSAKAGGGA